MPILSNPPCTPQSATILENARRMLSGLNRYRSAHANILATYPRNTDCSVVRQGIRHTHINPKQKENGLRKNNERTPMCTAALRSAARRAFRPSCLSFFDPTPPPARFTRSAYSDADWNIRPMCMLRLARRNSLYWSSLACETRDAFFSLCCRTSGTFDASTLSQSAPKSSWSLLCAKKQGSHRGGCATPHT